MLRDVDVATWWYGAAFVRLVLLPDVFFVAPGADGTPPGPAFLDLISVFLGDEEGWPPEGKKALVPLVFLVLSLVSDIFLGTAG